MAEWTKSERLAAARIFAQALPQVININTELNKCDGCKKDENDNSIIRNDINNDDNDDDDEESDTNNDSPTSEVGEMIIILRG